MAGDYRRIEPLGVVTDEMLNEVDPVEAFIRESARWFDAGMPRPNVMVMAPELHRLVSVAIIGAELTVAARWSNAIDELRDLPDGYDHVREFLREAIELDTERAAGRSLLR